MIKGFEDETKDLSDKEKDIARLVWKYLTEAFISKRSITNSEISKRVKQESGYPLAGARTRKVINWLHMSGHLSGLIATSKGYSRATNPQQLIDYKESLEGRINAINGRLSAVERDIKRLQPTNKTHT